MGFSNAKRLPLSRCIKQSAFTIYGKKQSEGMKELGKIRFS